MGTAVGERDDNTCWKGSAEKLVFVQLHPPFWSGVLLLMLG